MPPVKNIIFLLHSYGIGGEVLTCLRMACWLMNDGRYKVYIADRQESPLWYYLDKHFADPQKRSICQLAYNTQKLIQGREKFPTDAVIVTNGTFLLLNPLLASLKTQKFVFYFMEPHTYDDILEKLSFWQKLKYRWIIYQRLYKADVADALLFQDWPNYVNLRKYYPFLKKNYLPIAIETPVPHKEKTFHPEYLHICYIGRNVSSKNNALLFISSALSDYARSRKINITLSVISDIGAHDELHQQLYKNYPFIDIRFPGTLYGTRLNRFLAEQADVVISMGVSCLEGAKLGIPALSVPASSQALPPDTKVGFLPDFKDFSLGGFFGENNGLTISYSLAEALDRIRIDYDRLTDKQNRYVVQNLNINNTMARFLQTVKQTSFRFSDIG